MAIPPLLSLSHTHLLRPISPSIKLCPRAEPPDAEDGAACVDGSDGARACSTDTHLKIVSSSSSSTHCALIHHLFVFLRVLCRRKVTSTIHERAASIVAPKHGTKDKKPRQGSERNGISARPKAEHNERKNNKKI